MATDMILSTTRYTVYTRFNLWPWKLNHLEALSPTMCVPNLILIHAVRFELSGLHHLHQKESPSCKLKLAKFIMWNLYQMRPGMKIEKIAKSSLFWFPCNIKDSSGHYLVLISLLILTTKPIYFMKSSIKWQLLHSDNQCIRSTITICKQQSTFTCIESQNHIIDIWRLSQP